MLLGNMLHVLHWHYTWLSFLSSKSKPRPLQLLLPITIQFLFSQLNKMRKCVNQVSCFPNSSFFNLNQTPGSSLTVHTRKKPIENVLFMSQMFQWLCVHRVNLVETHSYTAEALSTFSIQHSPQATDGLGLLNHHFLFEYCDFTVFRGWIGNQCMKASLV